MLGLSEILTEVWTRSVRVHALDRDPGGLDADARAEHGFVVNETSAAVEEMAAPMARCRGPGGVGGGEGGV
jgi:hypothetical protein